MTLNNVVCKKSLPSGIVARQVVLGEKTTYEGDAAEIATDTPAENLEATLRNAFFSYLFRLDQGNLSPLTNIAPDWCPVDRVTSPYNGIDIIVKTTQSCPEHVET
jgi:hypothetical protein